MKCAPLFTRANISERAVLKQQATAEKIFDNFDISWILHVNTHGSSREEPMDKFRGVSGSEDKGGGDSSIQFINFGKVGEKVLTLIGLGRGRADAVPLRFLNETAKAIKLNLGHFSQLCISKILKFKN